MATATKQRGSNGFVANLFQEMVTNAFTLRTQLSKQLLDPPDRDLDSECGYPREISIEQYYQMYEREMGARVVSFYPSESWSQDPDVYQTEASKETAWEKSWNDLRDRLNIWHYLHRIDKLSGIGEFGVLLMGYNDKKDLSMPVEGVTPDDTMDNVKPGKANLIYLRCFDQKLVKIVSLEEDSNNPRYGQPTLYDLTINDVTSNRINKPLISDSRTKRVHWSRILHVADNRESSEVYGVPRQRNPFNRLLDFRKVLGGSGEMFFRGAFPGYSFELNPNITTDVELDEDSIRAEFEEYASGFRRYLALEGLTVKSLAPQVSDPTNHFMALLQSIAIALDAPFRIFMGTEEGKLAGDQDKVSWNERIKRRRDKYLTPMMIRPFINRQMMAGALPFIDKYIVTWPDPNSASEEDKASVGLKWTESLSKYSGSGASRVIPLQEFLSIFLGMNVDQVKAVVDAAKRMLAKKPPERIIQEEDETVGSRGGFDNESNDVRKETMSPISVV